MTKLLVSILKGVVVITLSLYYSRLVYVVIYYLGGRGSVDEGGRWSPRYYWGGVKPVPYFL